MARPVRRSAAQTYAPVWQRSTSPTQAGGIEIVGKARAVSSRSGRESTEMLEKVIIPPRSDALRLGTAAVSHSQMPDTLDRIPLKRV
jgi:hypothetical protein